MTSARYRYIPGHRGESRRSSVNAPGDIYEQEADRIADKVTAPPAIRRQCRAAANPAISWGTGGQMDKAPASIDKVLASPAGRWNRDKKGDGGALRA